MSTASQLRDWALCLAGLGWAVFPLLPDSKRPALHGRSRCPGTGTCCDGHQGWEQRATTDPDRIRRCWTQTPYNIGLATGPSKLVVLDLDEAKPGEQLPEGWSTVGARCGADVLDRLARRAGATVPETYTVATPSGGRHLYFRAPTELQLRNTAGDLGPLIDTRASGGYVVAPGSTAPGGAYELYDDSEPAELPGWLVQALAAKPSVELSAPDEIACAHRSRYVAAALRAEEQRVAAAKPQRQNHTLYIAALALGRLVAGGALDAETVRTVLHRGMSRLPNTRPDDPWTTPQVDATIRSAFRAAADNPRYLTSPDQHGKEAA